MGFLDKFKGKGKSSTPETAAGGAGEAGGGGNGSADASGGFKPDPRKARKFFEYGQTTADSGNFDYSIECYINGLRHEPESMPQHEALYEVAKRRKVKGGKPAGFGEKHKSLGPRPVDKMLQMEKIWAKDILNASAMLDFFAEAVEAVDKHPDLKNLAEVAYWIGGILLDNLATVKRPKPMLIKARDLFVRIEAFDKAVDACRRALAHDPNNNDLMQELKQLEASNAMQAGGYNKTSAEEGGFRQFVRDASKQQALEQDDTISKTASMVDQIIERRRAEYEEDPEDLDRMLKLVNALVQKETDAEENEAIRMLDAAFEETSSYRFKVRAGDIRMKQMNRGLRALRHQLKENPDDEQLRQQFEQRRREQLAFELAEYTERVKNYPTDLAIRFELGLRLYLSGQIDEAIGAFQQAKAEPKHRSISHAYLGQCYLQKDWLDEAIGTLEDGLAQHPVKSDRQGLELQYMLMNAYEKSAERSNNLEHAQKAREIGSSILQTNINYRDIRDRVEKVRALVDRLNG